MLPGYLVDAITKDGLELKGFWMDNKSDTAIFHSHGTAGDFYTHKFLELEGIRLRQKKISFLSANNRGHDVIADIRKKVGGKTEWVQIGGSTERFEDCILDISSWLDFLQKQGIKKVILQAHSLTQKILYYQHRKIDKRVIGQIHLSPCNDAGIMRTVLGEQKYKESNKKIWQMIKNGKEKEMLPAELSVICQMNALAYSGYLTEEGAGNLFPYHNVDSSKWDVLKNTKDPLLAVFGGSDAYIKPTNKIAAQIWKSKAETSKLLDVKVIEGALHSYLDHEEKLISVIIDWIKKIL